MIGSWVVHWLHVKPDNVVSADINADRHDAHTPWPQGKSVDTVDHLRWQKLQFKKEERVFIESQEMI